MKNDFFLTITVDRVFVYRLNVFVVFQAFFSANAAAQASRKSSPRVTNEAVQKAVSVELNDVVF